MEARIAVFGSLDEPYRRSDAKPQQARPFRSRGRVIGRLRSGRRCASGANRTAGRGLQFTESAQSVARDGNSLAEGRILADHGVGGRRNPQRTASDRDDPQLRGPNCESTGSRAREKGIVHRDLKPANVMGYAERHGEGAGLRSGRGGRGSAGDANPDNSPTMTMAATQAISPKTATTPSLLFDCLSGVG